MMYSNEWPTWLRALVITAIVITAVASIWGQVRDSKILRAVARQLGEEDAPEVAVPETDGTVETVKTQVSEAAKDSKSTEAGVVQLREDVAALNLKINRYIDHEVRNDLQSSLLAKEVEAELGRADGGTDEEKKGGGSGQT